MQSVGGAPVAPGHYVPSGIRRKVMARSLILQATKLAPVKNQRRMAVILQSQNFTDIDLMIAARIPGEGAAFEMTGCVRNDRHVAYSGRVLDPREFVVGGPCEMTPEVLMVLGEDIDGEVGM